MGMNPSVTKPQDRLPSNKRDKSASANPEQRGQRPKKQVEGLAARRIACVAFTSVLNDQIPLEEALESAFAAADAKTPGRPMDQRDRRFARALAIVAFRHFGAIDQRLKKFLRKPLPKKAEILRNILRLGLAQLDYMDVPDHAAVSLTVELARSDTVGAHFLPLVNGVMRAAGRDPSSAPGRANTVPAWLWRRWRAAYGEMDARQILQALVTSPDLDISVKSDPDHWALTLGGTVLPTGSVRITEKTAVEDLPGYEAGEWWVQDAAATLPARLLGPVEGLEVLDLCAAPGGKSAQLLAAGANTTIVDVSAPRLERLRSNLRRLRFDEAEVITADVLDWSPDRQFDAVLLDAPCSATGTIRRHPDVPHTKTEETIGALASLQAGMLKQARDWVKPGGILIYCTCSLEQAEGEEQIEDFLANNADYARRSVEPEEIGHLPGAITASGDVRTLPFMTYPQTDGFGMDGFFIARLVRKS